MRKRLLIGGSVLAASLVVVGSVIAVASTNITSPETIKLVGHTLTDAFVDADGDQQFSAGDYVVFSEALFNRDETQHVGELDVQCVFVSEPSTICNGTLTLFGRGQIAFQLAQLATDATTAGESFGTLTHDNPRGFHVAITGGTDEFSNARGEAVVLPGPGRDTERITVHLIP